MTEVLIATAERTLGVRFPRGLRARFARNNGGTISCAGEEWRLHPVRDMNDPMRAARTEKHVVYETSVARRMRGFPSDGIAIASGVDGEVLILRGDGVRTEIWSPSTHACSPVDVDWESDLGG